jgi:hypothetical protein
LSMDTDPLVRSRCAAPKSRGHARTLWLCHRAWATGRWREAAAGSRRNRCRVRRRRSPRNSKIVTVRPYMYLRAKGSEVVRGGLGVPVRAAGKHGWCVLRGLRVGERWPTQTLWLQPDTWHLAPGTWPAAGVDNALIMQSQQPSNTQNSTVLLRWMEPDL